MEALYTRPNFLSAVEIQAVSRGAGLNLEWYQVFTYLNKGMSREQWWIVVDLAGNLLKS